MEIYDLVILGGGPAGYNAAYRAAAGGMKTAVIEKRALGGVCLNEGCVPSKALLNSAKIYDYAKHGADYGVTFEGANLNQEAVIGRKNKVVASLVGGIGMKMKKLGVTVINAEGKILSKSGEGFVLQAGDTEIAGRKLLIATGSAPVIPPIPGLKEGLDSGFVMTNREILDLTEIPAKLVVIGGGVIGLEMASYFNSAGSEVTVIEMLDKIAGPTDKEISEILRKNYEKKGVVFRLGCKVTAVEADGVVYEDKNGAQVKAAADKVLCSIGRRAVTADIGLEKIGVETERGAVKTDDYMRTNVPGVYAAGDVNGRSMLAHTAYREGEVAVNNMLAKRDRMRYNAIPSVIYTNPEVASVGYTLDDAKKAGIDAACVNLSLRYSGRYVAENEGGDGIVKVVYDKKYSRIVGIHMIGSYASEIIYGAALMIETETDIASLRELVFPH
ncbi:MAG: dihydrolipoyl dehydrogenase, partial [Clostridia bacterium]|nr:dihydrolipoyl dehydrogenase [Clostridia bacterium]